MRVLSSSIFLCSCASDEVVYVSYTALLSPRVTFPGVPFNGNITRNRQIKLPETEIQKTSSSPLKTPPEFDRTNRFVGGRAEVDLRRITHTVCCFIKQSTYE